MFVGGGVVGTGAAFAQWVAGGNNFVGTMRLSIIMMLVVLAVAQCVTDDDGGDGVQAAE